MINSRFLTISAMIFLAAISRILPHPSNFTPIMAISLFSGAVLPKKLEALLIPTLAMLVSDFIIGFHPLIWVVYPCILLMVFFGSLIKEKHSTLRILGMSLSGSVLFFLITNFFVFLTTGMYPHNLGGLIQAYTLAIPFFQNSVLGDLFFTVVLFGALRVFEMRGWVSREFKPSEVKI